MAEFRHLDSPEATVAAGQALAGAMRALEINQLIVFLVGDLGAGKTTFARGFLRGWGHSGRVPSPTYTIIEPYQLESGEIYHIDLYRLKDPGEADDLGLAELPGRDVVMLVEWPERAGDRLPGPDLTVFLRFAADDRREIVFRASSTTGECLLAHKNI
jgi:tRNA threonylcarbamoyladenosine biosynthesis protein TsaE